MLGLVMALAIMCTMGLGQAVAQTAPAAGLGAHWPNAQDVSQRPEFHVYVFSLGGVKYIQVNDSTGNVRGGVATSADGSTAVPLPLGQGQVQVSSGAAPTDGVTVYQDGTTTVTASPSQGLIATPAATQMRAADCTSVPDCGKLNQ